jgi:hypothetical protein
MVNSGGNERGVESAAFEPLEIITFCPRPRPPMLFLSLFHFSLSFHKWHYYTLNHFVCHEG